MARSGLPYISPSLPAAEPSFPWEKGLLLLPSLNQPSKPSWGEKGLGTGGFLQL